MKSLVLLSLCIFCAVFGFSQTSDDKTSVLDKIEPENFRKEMAKTITSKDLKKHLSILASDEYEGRETGTDGNKRAAEYLAQMFHSYGLKPVGSDKTYMQPIDMVSERWEKIDFTVNGQKYRHLWDFFALHEGNQGPKKLMLMKLFSSAMAFRTIK